MDDETKNLRAKIEKIIKDQPHTHGDQFLNAKAQFLSDEESRSKIEETNLTNKNIADLMRSVKGDEAERIGAELKESLRVGMEILTEIINQWNEACADGDRGRGNDALGLIIYDDGSGKVVTYSRFLGEDYLNKQIEFADIAEGVDRLADWF
jgi:hypothetical protein